MTRSLEPTPELHRLATESLLRIASRIPYDRAAFCRAVDDEEIEVIAVAPPEPGLASPGAKLTFRDVLGSKAVQAGLVVEIDLEQSDLPFDRALLARGYRRTLRVPVGDENRALGAIAVARRGGGFSAEEIEEVASIAADISREVLNLAAGGTQAA